MIKNLIFSVVATGVLGATTSAGATNWTENVALCAAALDEQGIASSQTYRPKLQNVRDGSTKRVTVKMTSTADGAEPIIAECKIRRGEVVDVSVKA